MSKYINLLQSLHKADIKIIPEEHFEESDNPSHSEMFQNIQKGPNRQDFPRKDLIIIILICSVFTLSLVSIILSMNNSKSLSRIQQSLELFSKSQIDLKQQEERHEMALKDVKRSITDLKVKLSADLFPLKNSVQDLNGVIKKQEDQLLVFVMQMGEFKNSVRSMNLEIKVKQSEMNAIVTNYTKMEGSIRELKAMIKDIAARQDLLINRP